MSTLTSLMKFLNKNKNLIYGPIKVKKSEFKVYQLQKKHFLIQLVLLNMPHITFFKYHIYQLKLPNSHKYHHISQILPGFTFHTNATNIKMSPNFINAKKYLNQAKQYLNTGFNLNNSYIHNFVNIFPITGVVLLVPGSSGVMQAAVPIYIFVLMTMVWRAVARVQLFEELWTWTKLCSCIGGILFAFSDTIIGFNAFYTKVPYAQVLIMTSYYAAQLGISLSVVDSKASYLDSVRERRTKALKETDDQICEKPKSEVSSEISEEYDIHRRFNAISMSSTQ
ncbi:unnamed protein product, partial [Meganyctiphanes norvegica]